MTKNESATKQNVSKKKKRPIKTFFSVLFIFIACFLIYSSAHDVLMTVKLKKEISSHQEIVDELESEKSSLTKEKKNLENVKRFVRGKYLVSKPGEQVFILPSKNAAADEE